MLKANEISLVAACLQSSSIHLYGKCIHLLASALHSNSQQCLITCCTVQSFQPSEWHPSNTEPGTAKHMLLNEIELDQQSPAPAFDEKNVFDEPPPKYNHQFSAYLWIYVIIYKRSSRGKISLDYIAEIIFPGSFFSINAFYQSCIFKCVAVATAWGTATNLIAAFKSYWLRVKLNIIILL